LNARRPGTRRSKSGASMSTPPRDPVREARRLAETLDAAGQGPVVVMGFGLGYGAEAAAEKAPGHDAMFPLCLLT